ncbi:uncharacterized protein LOC125778978 isoform X2 [Bactrocera dorsalis]|uniref:Uncharacterized protein LOC125778978 isoform X2 n=1 Tax=Bactrocera dorsalis TaxID=27457 RepID=A0ABM3K0J0_BACDO|nr:uncharacterized protein LOC125778978 isoform X2 [Bactrocera dorsalis]
MLFLKLSFVFLVFLFSFGDTATVPTAPTIPIPGHCSVITSQIIKLSIFDLEDVQIKSALYLKVSEFENQTVGQLLNYLENVQHISLSSHTASVRSLNPPKDVSPFTTIPLSTPLCQAIDVSYDVSNADRLYTLFVGVELTPRQALVRRFSRGLVIDNHTGLFKMGTLSPVIFDKTYQPVEDPPTPSVVIEKHIIETVHTKESTASSQNGFSAEISAYIISVKAEYLKEKSSSSKNSMKTRNAVVSLLNKKTGLYVDEIKIDVDSSFVEKLYSIVDDKNLSSYDRTKLVVGLLNRYGWYVTNQFTLGGRLDVVKSLHVSSASNEVKELEALETKLGAAYSVFSASVGASSKKGSSSVDTTSHFSSDERITSTVDRATDIASFMEHVEIKENWRIIALDNIVPTCKFLLSNHSNLFAEMRRLIISNVHHQSISKLQPHINMLQYVNNIWDEYVQPF